MTYKDCTLLTATVICIMVTFFPSTQTYAAITVTAVVPPMRIIYVDKSSIIQEITNNTNKDIHPTIVILGEGNNKVAYIPFVMKQYMHLEPTLYFSHVGVLYKRNNTKSLRILNNVSVEQKGSAY